MPGRAGRQSTFTTKIFADRLSDEIALKKESGMTHKDIAEAIGVSTGALSEWCDDKKTPTIDMLAKLASYFNVSADWLIGLSGARSPDPGIASAVAYTGLSETCLDNIAAFQKDCPGALEIFLLSTWSAGLLDRLWNIFCLGFRTDVAIEEGREATKYEDIDYIKYKATDILRQLMEDISHNKFRQKVAVNGSPEIANQVAATAESIIKKRLRSGYSGGEK